MEDVEDVEEFVSVYVLLLQDAMLLPILAVVEAEEDLASLVQPLVVMVDLVLQLFNIQQHFQQFLHQQDPDPPTVHHQLQGIIHTDIMVQVLLRYHK
jgi:hypothetical protein